MKKFHKTTKGVFIFQDGHTYFFDKIKLQFDDKFNSSGTASVRGDMISPMPGKIFKLLVVVNQPVKAGQDVVVVEAMKMEHAIKSPFDGVVQDCLVKEGEQVELGQKLVQIKNTPNT